MKLLLISPLQKQANGGIAVWTEMFLAGCRGTDIEPTVVNIAMTGRRAADGTAKRSLISELRRTRRIFRDLKAALKRERFDVAHINTSCAPFGIIRDYLTAKKIKKKQPWVRVVVHYHCDIGAQVRGERAMKRLGRLVGAADKHITLCKSSAELLKDRFGILSETVPNPAGDSLATAPDRVIREKIEKAFFVGRVCEAKGVRELYAAAERLSDVKFELAGAVAPSAEALLKPDNVVFLGPLPHADVLRAMDEADIFVFPSHTEGFSIALIESMARGLPAIATDVGANADMLADGCGEVVAVRDVDAIVAAAERMQSAQCRRRISENARARVASLYTTEAVVGRIAEIYRS